jgi:hypothetical protein
MCSPFTETDAAWHPARSAGAGGTFYLTITDLVVESAQRKCQHSGALAVAAGLATTFILSDA